MPLRSSAHDVPDQSEAQCTGFSRAKAQNPSLGFARRRTLELRVIAGTAMAVVMAFAQAQSDVMARRPASELLAACETVTAQPGADSPAATLCLAFVEGFLWGHGWAAWRESRDPYFCPPGEGPVAARSLVPVVVSQLRAHPERGDQPAHLMLFSALSIAYPCDAEPRVVP
jgi:hypothetical protein